MSAMLQIAVQAYQAGRFEDGLAVAREGLLVAPADQEFGLVAALCCQALGRIDEAADVFAMLCARHPHVPEYQSNLGYMLRQLGRYVEAEQAFRAALNLAPGLHDALLNYGLLLMDMGHVAAARHRFLDAVDADPGSAAARVYAALACFECGDARRAESLIPAPAEWPLLDADLRHDLAMALIQVGRVDEAEQMLSVDANTSHDPAATARLAMLYERTNRVEQARVLMERIATSLDHAPQDLKVDALTVQSALALRDRNHAGARAANEALLALGLPAQARANAHFALAKIADSERRPDEAMRELRAAHAIHFQLAQDIVPEIAASAEEPLRIGQRWLSLEEAAFPRYASDPDRAASPVFIVGFPRSGTTMLEQMLDAHPGFASMDERATLQRCVERMEARGLQYPGDLAQLDQPAVDDLRRLYWDEVARVISLQPGQTLVDKNPLNMLRLPMIRRLFPQARIVMALRHPCDVVLSCYMQNFRSPAFMVLCSTLERLAKSYVNAMRFWIHHQPLLAPDALLLRYEETVGDFQGQVGRIAEYLGIDDSDYLADFASHAARKNYISTPSYAQVVEPVNTRAVARWEAYRPWFEPVLSILQPVADHWGYELGTAPC